MTAFFVRFTLQLLVPIIFAAASFYFFRQLAFWDWLAVAGSGFLGVKLAQQGFRNANVYLEDYSAGLARKSPTAFILKYALPFLAAIPAAFGADALDWHYGFFIPSVTGLAVGGTVFAIAYTAIRIDYGPLRTLFIGGRYVRSYHEARRIAGRLSYSEGYLFGGIRIPERLATQHFLAVGSTGSGKTVTIRLLLEDITASMKRQRNAHTVIYDPKANVLPGLRKLAGNELPLTDFHPFRQDAYAWDMSADVRTSQDIEAVANTLIPVEKEASENPFFANAPRELMQFVMRGLLEVAASNWTLRDVYLIMTSPAYAREMLKATAEGRVLVPQYFESKDPRTLSNILLSIRTRMLRYRTIAAATHQAAKAGRLLSLKDWSRSGRGFLVLGADKVQDSGIQALNRVVIQLLAKYWLLGPDSPAIPKHFLVLDEVQSAGKIEALSEFLTQGREKGVSAVFGFQDVSSIRHVYGADATEALLGQFSNKALLRLEGDSTSQWASRIVGEVDQFEYTYGRSETSSSAGLHSSHSVTHSTNESRVRRAALMPSDFLSIRPTNRRNGLSGYYSSPEIGVWKHTYPASHLWGPGDVQGSQGGGASEELDFPLEPFDADDLRRLKLPDDVQQQPVTEPEPETKTPTWQRVRTDWLPPE